MDGIQTGMTHTRPPQIRQRIRSMHADRLHRTLELRVLLHRGEVSGSLGAEGRQRVGDGGILCCGREGGGGLGADHLDGLLEVGVILCGGEHVGAPGAEGLERLVQRWVVLCSGESLGGVGADGFEGVVEGGVGFGGVCEGCSVVEDVVCREGGRHFRWGKWVLGWVVVGCW